MAAPALTTDVSVRVLGIVAHTEVVQRFKNDDSRVSEGRYVFPLPEGSDRAINRLRLTMLRRHHARSRRRTDAGVRRVTCCAQSGRFGTAQDGTAVEFRSLRAAFRRASPAADEPYDRADKKRRAPKLGTLGWFVESVRDRGRAEGDLERIAAGASDRESARRDSIQSPHRSA
ncbi:MAG: hypothetical protein IPK13_10050 [Deltaproteobacteria bacterium]|nr:hypothetical protein [Deltaproteobacteria bacterium]